VEEAEELFIKELEEQQDQVVEEKVVDQDHQHQEVLQEFQEQPIQVAVVVEEHQVFQMLQVMADRESLY
jgi:CBS domain containing-hemolysin-like protein